MTPTISTLDINRQTAADMKAARSRTSFSVQTVRNYLYGKISALVCGSMLTSIRGAEGVGPTRTPAEDPGTGTIVRKAAQVGHPVSCCIFRITSRDRDFLNQMDQYIRATAITNRLDELRRLHSWSQEEYTTAMSLVSENIPLLLHEIGI